MGGILLSPYDKLQTSWAFVACSWNCCLNLALVWIKLLVFRVQTKRHLKFTLRLDTILNFFYFIFLGRGYYSDVLSTYNSIRIYKIKFKVNVQACNPCGRVLLLFIFIFYKYSIYTFFKGETTILTFKKLIWWQISFWKIFY